MRASLAWLALASLASATPAPVYPGYKVVWSESFGGKAGASPDKGRWNLITEYVIPTVKPAVRPFFPPTHIIVSCRHPLTQLQRTNQRRSPNLHHL